jgi:hypothetical protein
MTISITAVGPNPVAPNQTLTVTGSGFGATQGGTTLQLGGVTVTPVSWADTQITFKIPNGTTPGYSSVSVGGVVFPAVIIATALALPGGSSAVTGQPVHITGSGFGAGLGTLLYFSVSGELFTAAVTDWSNTDIYSNVPSTADLGNGFFYVVPAGATQTAFSASFTVAKGSAVPQGSVFVEGQTWVTSTNRTYPQTAKPERVFMTLGPRGRCETQVSPTQTQVQFVTEVGYTPQFQPENANFTDLQAMGPLTTATEQVLGQIQIPPIPPSTASATIVANSSVAATATLIAPMYTPFVTSYTWSTRYLKDDGSQSATQSTTVSNTAPGTVSVTNGQPTVSTSPYDYSAIIAPNNQIVFGSQPGTPYTVLSITSTTITLTGNYTGTTNASTSLAYNQVAPTGTVQFQIDSTNVGSPVAVTTGTITSASITGGTSPLVDGTHAQGGNYSGDLNYNAVSGSNTGNHVLSITVYNPNPIFGLSTQLIGTFTTTDGSTFTTTQSQVGVLDQGDPVVTFSNGGSGTINSSSVTSSGFSLLSGPITAGSGMTAYVSGCSSSGGGGFPLVLTLACNETSGPTPSGTVQFWINTTSGWTDSSPTMPSGSLTAEGNAASYVQLTVAVDGSSSHFRTSSPGSFFSFSYAGDSHFNAVAAPTGSAGAQQTNIPSGGGVWFNGLTNQGAFIFTPAG